MLVSFGLLVAGILLLVSICSTFGIPFLGYEGAYGQQKSQTLRNLGVLADQKKERLVFWLAERKSDARVLASAEFVRSSADRVVEQVEQGRARGNAAPIASRSLGDAESNRPNPASVYVCQQVSRLSQN